MDDGTTPRCVMCDDTGFVFVPWHEGSYRTVECQCGVASRPKGWTVTTRVYCCRAWDVLPGVRIGSCGYCGLTPRAPQRGPEAPGQSR